MATTPLAGHRQPAVGQQHQRAGLLASRAQRLAAPPRPRSARARRGRPSPRARAHAEDRRAARASAPAPGLGLPERARRASARTAPRPRRAPWPRTRMCSRSPASISVEPRGQQRLVVAHDHADQRLARQLELVHHQAHDRVGLGAPGTRAPRRRAAGWCPPRAGGGRARARRWSRPAPARAGSSVAPCTSVEVRTTKKTMLKIDPAFVDALDHREGGEHDRHGAAQARPADQRRLAQAHAGRRPWPRARPPAGPRTSARRRSAGPRPRCRRTRDGFTSSPRVRNIAIWLIQASPSWKSSIVRLPGIAALPSASPAR